MGLDAAGLTTAIANAIASHSWAAVSSPGVPSAAVTELAQAIAVAVVAEITAHAVVTVPGTGLVAPGGGGPVTGFGTGTIA